MNGGRQLVLDLGAAPRMGREDFMQTEGNAAALQAVDSWPDWPERRMILAGPSGSGRSHLAAIWQTETRAAALSGLTLKLPEQAAAYAIDDADAVAGEPRREEALFHLLNRALAEGAPVLMTARDTPGTWGIALPDLQSRLLACAVTHLDRPDDTLLCMSLVKLGEERQLMLDPGTVDYLVARMDRSVSFAHRIVDALDYEAYSRQKRVSRTMAAEVLANLQQHR